MPSVPALVPATMDDVARTAGVAVSTVSRALRNDGRIGSATRQRVREVAQQLNYRPNPMVAALMSQLRVARPPAATCNLAWLDFSSQAEGWKSASVLRAFYAGAIERARSASYIIERVQTRAPGMTPGRLARILQSRGIRGVLVPPFQGGNGLVFSILLPLDEFAIVTVGTRFRDPSLHFASNDQFASSRLAVLELWKLGYRRIGFISVPFAEAAVNNRFVAGYMATLQLELPSAPLPPLISTDAMELAHWLRAQKPDVVLTTDSELPEKLRAQGWSVPETIGIAHMHVAPEDSVTSGICQNSALVGGAAVDLLIGQLCSNECGIPDHPKGVVVPGSWVPGRTVRMQH